MATGNDMMMEAVKLVEGIVGELRGFDETPPPKKAWIDIANRLEKAFGDYREAMMSFMDDMGKRLGKLEGAAGGIGPEESFDMLAEMEWKETMFLDLQTHDFGGGIFMLRCKHGEPNEHYCIIKANDVDEAISRAVFDLHKPSEQIGNVGKLRNALSRTHTWLGVLIRDSRPGDGCSQCIGASDLADDVYDALNSPARNCDRFSDETEAMVAFLNEVWFISVKDLKEHPFYEWTPVGKERYAKWLMEKEEVTDKDERR